MHSAPKETGRLSSRGNPWAVAFGAGMELAVSVLLGVAAGRWADRKFGTEPWLVLAGTVLGIGLGLYFFIRQAVVSHGRDA
jgi:F0F1-type ATP synthase assembly protein I